MVSDIIVMYVSQLTSVLSQVGLTLVLFQIRINILMVNISLMLHDGISLSYEEL